MPDYIYLLENRLSSDQQSALKAVREAAREAHMTVFLTGGAVRDLTSGSPVRDLDFSVHGNALKLKKTIEKAGGVLTGEEEQSRTLFFRFARGARAEVSSARREVFPKPGKPEYHWASLLEDLRRRDFTANAMALSLNEGSYGLLMDPLNGVADIEARLLRLVSNYGFLEDPIRLVRATRFAARLGWEMDEKTKARYDNAKAEGVISAITAWQRGYELEEIAHEEDGLKALKALEAEGWMKHLDPAWTSARADVAGLEQMREVVNQLQMQGVSPDTSAAAMELLTAKMPPKELGALKKRLVRPGFVEQWNSLEPRAKEFAKVLTAKQAAPSETWKLLTTADPEAVLWLALTNKAAAVQEKYKSFFSVWPEARQKVPYALMQELRITPELSGYQDLLKNLFFALIDGRLGTEEEMRAFLEPYSPPAPPPPVTIRRPRAPKKAAEPKVKAEPPGGAPAAEGAAAAVTAEPKTPAKAAAAKKAPAPAEAAPAKPVPVKPVPAAPAKVAAAKPAPAPPAKAASAKPAPVQAAPAKTAAKIVEKAAPQKHAAAKTVPAKAAPAKSIPAVPAKAAPVPAKAAPAKPTAKKAAPKAVPVKAAKAAQPKVAAKPAAKPALAKAKPVKAAARPTPKTAKPVGTKIAAKAALKKPAAKPKTATKHKPAKPAKKKR